MKKLLVKFRGALVFLLLFAIFSSLMVGLLYTERNSVTANSKKVAVVLYGTDSDRWRSLDQGVRQACIELGIEKPVISTASSPQHQMELIQREVETGAKGLVVAPTSSNALREFLEQINSSVPVMLVETASGDKLPCVAADDTAMAEALATLYASDDRKVAVLADNMSRSSVAARLEAFQKRMDQLGKPVMVLEKKDGPLSSTEYLTGEVWRQQPDVLVALDDDTLAMAARAVELGELNIEVAGIGCSDVVVHALDKGYIARLCYSNEYAVGYLAVKRLAEKMGLGPSTDDIPIQYGIASQQSLYEPDIMRILFPIIQ